MVLSITTTARDVFFGGDGLDALAFKNGSATGTIYLRNKAIRDNVITTSDYEWSLGPGEPLGISRKIDGEGIVGPWQAISDTGGGVTLEILPIYAPGKSRR